MALGAVAAPRPDAAATASGATRTLAGRIMTVRGPIDPSQLGIVLMHEHLASDMLLPDVPTGYRGHGPLTSAFVRRFQETGRYFRMPRTAEQTAFWDAPNLEPTMLDGLGRGWLTKSQFVLDDREAAAQELEAFRTAGGGSVVDVTTIGIGRDPVVIRALSERSGVPVVMGTGWYRWMFHPPDLARRSVDDLADQMVTELTTGVGATGIRAGIIGEIPIDAAGLRLPDPPGTIVPDSVIVARRQAVQDRIRAGGATAEHVYDAEEIKVLRAAARASRRTGAALTLHAPDPWIAYLDVIAAEGADLRRVVVGHADLVLLDEALAREAFARGVTLQIDYQLQRYGGRDIGPFDQLLDRVAWAVRAGYGHQVLVSLDLCFRQGLMKFGGGGYPTLFERIIPGLEQRGLTADEIDAILVETPKRLLTIVEPRG